jgi:methyltransferase
MTVLGIDLDSRFAYTALVAAVAAARLAELRVAEGNRRRLVAAGGVETGAGHYPAMAILHGAWLLACLAEVWWLRRPLIPPLAAAMLLLLGAAMALRYWVISTLGGRWTTRIVVLPGAPPIESGPFRLLRHPNYLAVVVEILALPLVHTAWLTAIVFSAANGAVLAVRIGAEERALAAASDYAERFAGRRRLVPGRPGSPAP